MHRLDLRLRNLETAELLDATFESELDARTWLLDRPRNIEVLGVATHGLPTPVYAMLRAAARPLDEDERALARALDAAEEDAARRAEEEARRQDAEELEAHRDAMRRADPDRPLTVHWTLDEGLRVLDPLDPRGISAAAQEAVRAWIAERDEWVRERGQHVVEATVTVWPGPVPAGAERVHPGGHFVPAYRAEP